MSEPDWNKWIDSSHWISLYPKGHINEDDGFGDCPHHTGFLVTAMILKGQDIPKWFNKGVLTRAIHNRNVYFVRHPKIDTRMNRDQLVPLIFPMYEAGYKDKALGLIQAYTTFLFPHQWMHFQRSMNVKRSYFLRLLCDGFECLDSISDWFSNSESSQIKNIYRLTIATYHFPTIGIKFAKFLFELRVDPKAVMKEYFTRYYPYQPPIHEAWEDLLK